MNRLVFSCLSCALVTRALAADPATVELALPADGAPNAANVRVVPPAPPEDAPAPEAAPAPTPAPAPKEPEFGITILARRKADARIVGSAQVIGEKELELHQYDDVQRVLKDVPGVYVREEDGFGLRPNIGLRGASSDRSAKVTLMEDGVLFGPAPYSAPAAYFFPLSTRLAGVEVFKGPASVRSGPQTVGGALNLLTRRIPEIPSGGVELAGGLYGTGRAHGWWGASGERFGVLLEGVRLQSDGFKHLDGGGDTGFDKNEVMLKGRWQSSVADEHTHRLELKLGVSTEESRETYLGLSEADFQADPWRRYAASRTDVMRWWRTEAELSHAFAASRDFEVRTVAYRHDFARAWHKLNGFRGGPDLATLLKAPASGRSRVYQAILAGREDTTSDDELLQIGTNDRAFVSQGLQTTGRWATQGFGVAQTLQFGARLHQDSIRRIHTEDAYDMTAGQLVARGLPTETTTKNTGSARALALHVLDELEFGSLIVSPGARLELISMRLVDDLAHTTGDRFDAVLLPGLGAAWAVNKRLTLLAGVHRGFSPVAPGQAAEVKPESSLNVEAGGRWATRHARAELVGFYNRYSNLTGECTNSSGCTDEQINTQYNGGAADVGGVEASAGAETKAGPVELRARASYTLTVARFGTSFSSEFPQFGDVVAGDELPYVPTHQGALHLGVAGQGWELAAAATYVGAMRDRAGQGEVAPGDGTDPQLVFDVVGSYAFDAANKITLKADNLFDSAFIASRRPFGIRPAQPQMVMLGYKHAFGGAATADADPPEKQ